MCHKQDREIRKEKQPPNFSRAAPTKPATLVSLPTSNSAYGPYSTPLSKGSKSNKQHTHAARENRPPNNLPAPCTPAHTRPPPAFSLAYWRKARMWLHCAGAGTAGLTRSPVPRLNGHRGLRVACPGSRPRALRPAGTMLRTRLLCGGRAGPAGRRRYWRTVGLTEGIVSELDTDHRFVHRSTIPTMHFQPSLPRCGHRCPGQGRLCCSVASCAIMILSVQ